MNDRQSIICPSCNKLISGYQAECPFCGLKHPAQKHRLMRLFGFRTRNFVKLIISINVAFFIISYLIPLFLPVRVPSGRDFLGLLPAPSQVSLNLLGWADIRLFVSGHWWVLITAIFLHGGLLHILFNMLWIRDLGPLTENLFGTQGLLIVFILSGVIGNLVAIFTPLFLNALFHSQSPFLPVIGASGSVFGLMGSIIAFGRKRGGIFGRQLVRQLGMWAVILIVMGFLFPGISNAAHIGGLIGGFCTGHLLAIQKNPGRSPFVFFLSLVVMAVCAFALIRMATRMIQIVGGL